MEVKTKNAITGARARNLNGGSLWRNARRCGRRRRQVDEAGAVRAPADITQPKAPELELCVV